MAQSLAFSHQPDIETPGGRHRSTVSSNLSYHVLGCFAANSPKFSWGQVISVFSKPGRAPDPQEWVRMNDFMARTRQSQGPCTFLVSIVPPSITSPAGRNLRSRWNLSPGRLFLLRSSRVKAR